MLSGIPDVQILHFSRGVWLYGGGSPRSHVLGVACERCQGGRKEMGVACASLRSESDLSRRRAAF